MPKLEVVSKVSLTKKHHVDHYHRHHSWANLCFTYWQLSHWWKCFSPTKYPVPAENTKKRRKIIALGFFVHMVGLNIICCLETRKKLKYPYWRTRISFFPGFHARIIVLLLCTFSGDSGSRSSWINYSNWRHVNGHWLKIPHSTWEPAASESLPSPT